MAYYEITEQELLSLTTAIQKKFGLDLTGYEPKSLTRRVNSAMKTLKIESTLDLWSRILRDPKYINHFIDQLTVGMTSLFRDPKFWKKLEATISNGYFDKKHLKIWHAGCSTGEEIYSMSILLDGLKDLPRPKVIATDLNQTSLNNAQQGCYSLWIKKDYQRNLTAYKPKAVIDDYASIDESKNTFTFNKDLTKHITFKQHSLVDEVYPTGFDIIFCRNVLIYFDDKLKREVLNRFHKSLNKDGLLIIGYFDSVLPILNREIFDIYDQEAKLFRKISSVPQRDYV